MTGAIALFKQAATLISDGPGKAALRRSSYQVNVAQTEAVFVGLMRRLQHGNITSGAVGDVVLQLRKTWIFNKQLRVQHLLKSQ